MTKNLPLKKRGSLRTTTTLNLLSGSIRSIMWDYLSKKNRHLSIKSLQDCLKPQQHQNFLRNENQKIKYVSHISCRQKIKVQAFKKENLFYNKANRSLQSYQTLRGLCKTNKLKHLHRISKQQLTVSAWARCLPVNLNNKQQITFWTLLKQKICSNSHHLITATKWVQLVQRIRRISLWYICINRIKLLKLLE